ncbi:PLD nuclease N-terminal domain-containing protein [Enterococcus sp.]|jgi:hypothetical protein|uniref:PLD nuclease N-terminal domain-containing protein n=1 Tax=Enterococcus sp. TaxID=35783 RepID=UPI0025C5A183|nr:PLD nuclease N-terminal domain-containing protein [Enterococcus sp.]
MIHTSLPENFSVYLPILIPLVLLQFTLILVSVLDIVKQKQFKFGNRTLWILVSCLISIIGPILYFTFGKGEKE